MIHFYDGLHFKHIIVVSLWGAMYPNNKKDFRKVNLQNDCESIFV